MDFLISFFLAITAIIGFSEFLVAEKSDIYNFSEYTSKVNDDALKVVRKYYKVVDDAPYCKMANIWGFVRPDGYNSVYSICTQSIVNWSNRYRVKPAPYINETVTHENVHAIQFCNPPEFLLGYDVTDEAIKRVHQAEVYKGRPIESLKLEYEAFTLEDYPKTVKEEADIHSNCS